MKLALIGDPHFANKKLFGTPTDIPGVNARLQNTLDVFKWILEDMPQDVREVCVLGDITHDHGHVTPPIVSEVRSLFDAFNGYDMNVTLLKGNHDIDSNGCSIIGAFENSNSFELPGTLTVSWPGQIYWSYPVPIYAIPYCSHDDAITAFRNIEKEYKLLKVSPLVLMHHHFEGAVHGVHEFEPPGGIGLKEIPDCVQMVISGHYHTAQKIGSRVEYIGTPVQHDFGEANNTPKYWVIDFAEDGEFSIERRDIQAGARFHILPHNFSGTIPGDAKKDFYRIDLPTDVNPTDIDELRSKLTNVIIKPIPVAVELRSRVGEVLQEEEDKVDVDKVIEAYARINAVPERVDDLIELAKDLVEASKS